MTEKKKIAVVSLHTPGLTGVGTSRWNFACVLSRLGHDVYFITESQYLNQIVATSPNPINVIGLHSSLCARSLLWSLGMRINKNIFNDVSPVDIEVIKFASSVSSNLPGIIKKYHIDTVFFSESFMEFIYFMPFEEVKTFVSFNCPRYLFQEIGLSNAPVNKYLRRKEEELVPLADKWFTPSHAMANLASKYYGIDSSRITVIPNCIDTETFYPKEHPEENEPAKICFVGRFSKEKGAELVIDIIPELMRKYPDLSFSIAGDSSQIENGKTYIDILRKRLEECCLQDRFLWHKHIPQPKLSDFYRRHNIFISPTLFESFGMSIVEAQACGLPVIVTKAGGTPETLNDNHSGFLIPINDSKIFSEKLETLIKDNQLRMRMGQAGRDFTINNFSYEAVGDKLKAFV